MYISTKEMVISIICNACGVLGLILWAIEAHKSNADQRTQSVESVENNGDIIVRSNLYPFRVVEADRKTENSSEKPNNCEAQTDYKKWDAPQKVELPKEITTCVSVLASALEGEPQTERSE